MKWFLILLAALTANFEASAQIKLPSGFSEVVSLGFDDNNITPGPSTFLVFQNAKGFVDINDQFAASGYRSFELQEVPLDGNFVELQRTFPLKDSGTLLLSFAFLVTNPEDEFNIALAGPNWFILSRDGIGFWLKGSGGKLALYSDSIPKLQAKIQAFRWYRVLCYYHIASGTLDFALWSEGNTKPVVTLNNIANATANLNSRVQTLSFIGDLDDRSSVHYFVDDVVVAYNPDEKITLDPSVNVPIRFKSPDKPPKTAPIGSRAAGLSSATQQPASNTNPNDKKSIYFEGFEELSTALQHEVSCIPAIALKDFGIETEQIGRLKGHGLWEEFSKIFDGELELRRLDHFHGQDRAVALSVLDWRRGCRAINNKLLPEATAELDNAKRLNPNSPIIDAAIIVALTLGGKEKESELALMNLFPRWQADPRFTVLAAWMTSFKGNLSGAISALKPRAEELLTREIDQPLLKKILSADFDAQGFIDLQRDYPDRWRHQLDDLLLAQNYYYLLIWDRQLKPAEEFVQAMVARYSKAGISRAAWFERLGDISFLKPNLEQAIAWYRHALEEESTRRSARLKLIEVEIRLGKIDDAARERDLLQP